MAEPMIEDVMEFLQARQQVVNTAINELNRLREHGSKYKAADKTTLLASIVSSLGSQSALADAAWFKGASR